KTGKIDPGAKPNPVKQCPNRIALKSNQRNRRFSDEFFNGIGLEQAQEEVTQGAAILASELGQRSRHFAYPYGYRNAASTRDFGLMSDLGFTSAVTTRGGMLFPAHQDHMTALPRISINGLYQKMRYFGPLTTGLPTRLGNGLRRVSVG
ncbi:MAG: polysaccharide deacetylase family protein, partial [Rhizobiaceae bacterium]|nr:polysaccharide deacetylase family protein [Rhizobiaceae bacterium]